MRLTAGTFSRLGASWDGRGTNFALFSANAEKVELCLFDNQGRRELERIELPERTEDVWHGYLNDVSPGQLYGYRVHGPYDPEHGQQAPAGPLCQASRGKARLERRAFRLSCRKLSGRPVFRPS
jgi:glycogen operon protein